MSVPTDLKYAKSHEWLRKTGEEAEVGITDYAQKEMGDIVFVELPEIEKVFQKGQECAVIESVKAASDIYAPVSGKITAVNDALEANPELINSDPYGKGWIFKISQSSQDDINELMGPDAYSEIIE
ncbi:MAG: glycine cleavage system protein GcvH [Candidatus Theseobacter exili]|nr:glycine cleavage system protein GcvH [Candidatus Theseobacter exili]